MEDKSKLEPKIQVEINLLSGGRIGTLVVLSSLDHVIFPSSEYVERIIEDQIRQSIDMLIINGAQKITEKHNKIK